MFAVVAEIFPNTTSRENITMKVGKSASYECSAEGQPTPVVQWQPHYS